jgi:RNA polymerase sigma-54 factor
MAATRLQTRPVARTVLRTATAQIVTFASTLSLDGPGIDALVDRELAEDPALERDLPDPPWGHALRSSGAFDPDALPTRCDQRAELAMEVAACLPSRDRHLAAALVDELDDRGFLASEPADIARRAGVELARLRGALDVLHTVAPVGVGTTGPVACVVAHLRVAPVASSLRCLAERILTDTLALAAAGDVERIAVELAADVHDVDAALDAIRGHARPVPAWDGEVDTPIAAPPDLIVIDADGLRAEAVERRRHRLRVASSYLAPGAPEGQVARAETFIARLEERWRTMERVGGHVVRWQSGFVRDRREALRDLTRSAVAADLGVHPSTVSRAVTNRTVALPDGRVLPLSALFANAELLRRELARLLALEQRPTSDASLARELRMRGYVVARRTVAKYRTQLEAAPLSAG